MAGREGQTLGTYRLTRLLGSGGFAEVYLGVHLHLGTLAAIKVLSTQLVTAGEIEKFRQEARTIAALVHPNIVRVFDFNVEEGVPYLVMDYAPNGSLRQQLPQGTPLPLATMLPYVKQVASALQYAHEQRLIHRDVKPENMLLGRQQEVLLSDFGTALIAQATTEQSTQGVAGTAGYMAPEQLQGRPRPASDQYALGIVVYEWLSGTRPFQGNYLEIASQHVLAPPPPLRLKLPALSPLVEQVVLTALAKDPKDRFASVLAFANALEQAAQGIYQATPASARLSVSTPHSLPPSPTSPPPGTRYPAGPWGGEGENAVFPPLTPHPEHSLSTLADAPPGRLPAAGLATVAAPPEERRGISRRGLLAAGVGGLVLVGGGGALLVVARGGLGSVFGGSPTPTPMITPSVTGRLVTTYRGQQGEVDELVWMPVTGSRVASASYDKTVHIWDASTAATIVKYLGHSDQVWTLAWSPNGKLIASGGKDKTVQVWDAASGLPNTTYTGHSAEVEAVAWSPDSTLIASASYDKTVRVWEALTQQFITTYSGHSDRVWAADWSPDGKLIASGSRDATVHIWDAMTGTLVRKLLGHSAAVPTVKWSPDGKHIASSSYDTRVRVWDPQTGDTVAFYGEHLDQVFGLSWSPDGEKIASASRDGTVRIWDATSGSTLYVYRNHTGAVNDVAWSPDGTRLASAGADQTAQVWLAG